MKMDVVNATDGTVKTVDMTLAEADAFRAGQSMPEDLAVMQFAAKEEAARGAFLREQMDKRSRDADAPQELKDWLAARTAAP